MFVHISSTISVSVYVLQVSFDERQMGFAADQYCLNVNHLLKHIITVIINI